MSQIIEEPVGSAKPNLAPMDQLQKAAKGVQPDKVKLPDFIKSRYASLSKEREDVWREIYGAAHLLALFCRGKQQVRRAKYSAGWRPYGDLRDTGVDDIRAINLTRFYIDNIVVKWVQSAADLVVQASNDNDQAILAARGSDIVVEHYEDKLYTPFFKQREARLAILTGTYVRRYYYEEDGSSKARRPLFEDVEFGGGESMYCTDCGYASQETSPTGACPQCGSTQVVQDSAPPAQVQSLKQIDEYASGGIKCESVPLWNLRYDLSESLEKSPYLIYSRRVRRDVVMGQLRGKVRVNSGKTQDAGLDAAWAIIYNGPAVGGKNLSGTGSMIDRADEEDAQFVDLIEMWLEPEMYGHIILKEAVQTVAGQEIPAGPLIDAFPEGMCAMGIDKMGTILYLFNEPKCDHWVSQQYNLDVLSGAGDGLVDVIEIQRQFNIGNSQIFTQIRANATPAVLYDKDLIAGDKAAYLGNPKMNIPVDLTRLPEQRTLQQTIYQLQPGQLPGHVIEYVHQFLNNMFQLTAHTTDFSGGLPGVKNDTATGAEIGRSLAQSLHAPQLQLLAEMNQRGALLVLRLFKKYCTDEHYLKLSGKNEADDGIWLKAADIDTDVKIDIVSESWLPQSGQEKKDKLKQFLEYFGGVQGLQQAIATSPKLVGEIAQLSNVQLDIGDWSAVLRLCRSRVEQMKKGLPIAETLATSMDPALIQQMTDMGQDPAVLFANMLLNQLEPKPDIREEGHSAAANYYCSWLTTDEGLKATPIMREAVKALADQHGRFFQMGGAAAAAAMPVMAPMGMPGQPGGGAPAMEMSGQPQAQAAAQANMGSPQPGAMQ